MKKFQIIKLISRGKIAEKFQTVNASGLTFPVMNSVPLYMKEGNFLVPFKNVEEGKIIRGIRCLMVIAPNIEMQFIGIGKKLFIPTKFIKPYEAESKSSVYAVTEQGAIAEPILIEPSAVTPSFIDNAIKSFNEVKQDANSHFPVMAGAGLGIGLGVAIGNSIPLPKFLTVIALGLTGAFLGKEYYDKNIPKMEAQKSAEVIVEKVNAEVAGIVKAEDKVCEIKDEVQGILPVDELLKRCIYLQKAKGKVMPEDMQKRLVEFYNKLTNEKRRISSEIVFVMCESLKLDNRRRSKYIVTAFASMTKKYGSDQMEELKKEMEDANLEF